MFEGKKCRFSLVLHDTTTEAYERRFFSLNYFLADDTIEVREVPAPPEDSSFTTPGSPTSTTRAIATPRTGTPRGPGASPQETGMGSTPRAFGPSTPRSRSSRGSTGGFCVGRDLPRTFFSRARLARKPAATGGFRAVERDFIQLHELLVGSSIVLLGTEFQVHECCDFTRSHFKTFLGLEQPVRPPLPALVKPKTWSSGGPAPAGGMRGGAGMLGLGEDHGGTTPRAAGAADPGIRFTVRLLSTAANDHVVDGVDRSPRSHWSNWAKGKRGNNKAASSGARGSGDASDGLDEERKEEVMFTLTFHVDSNMISVTRRMRNQDGLHSFDRASFLHKGR